MLTRISAALRAQPPQPVTAGADEVDRLYRHWRVRVMYATITGYALFYFVRKNLSMAAKAITDEFHSLWVRYPEACFGLVGRTGLSANCIMVG